MRFFERLLAPFAALLALAGTPAAARAPEPAAAHPALWEISKPGTTIYLFGTVHLLPEHFQWRTPKFDKALTSSDELVVETIVDLQHPEEFASAFAQLSLSPKPLPPILDRVSASKRAALVAALAQLGLKPEQLTPVKTWAIAFQLMGLQFVGMGLKGEEGPEAALRLEFTAAHKPIDQLETIRQQLSFFDSLSEAAQRELLEGTLDTSTASKDEFAKILTAWSHGDVPGLAQAFSRDVSGLPELKTAFFDRRNINWTHWIEHRLTQPGTVMIAVGADHLSAGDSVVALLKRDGYQVRRIQ